MSQPVSDSLKCRNSERPFIENVMLCSIDGAIAIHSGESTRERKRNGFTNEEDQLLLKRIVSECDAVFIGRRTLEAEGGAFRVGDLRADGSEPLWCVFSRDGECDLSLPFWRQTDIPKTLCACLSFDLTEEPHYQEIVSSDLVATRSLIGNIGGIFSALRNRGVARIALLGGGSLNGLFWRAGLVDQIYLTISPFLIGGDLSVPLIDCAVTHPLRLISCRATGDFVFLVYRVSRSAIDSPSL